MCRTKNTKLKIWHLTWDLPVMMTAFAFYFNNSNLSLQGSPTRQQLTFWFSVCCVTTVKSSGLLMSFHPYGVGTAQEWKKTAYLQEPTWQGEAKKERKQCKYHAARSATLRDGFSSAAKGGRDNPGLWWQMYSLNPNQAKLKSRTFERILKQQNN